MEENDSDAEAHDDWGEQQYEQQYSPSANPEKRKRVLWILVWITVKTWVTGPGERAQFEDMDIKYQLELAEQDIMNEG